MADQVAQPQLEAEPGVAHPGDHLQAEDGIAAQLEEVVADADLLDPQHLLPDRRQPPLDLGARRAMVAIGLRALARGETIDAADAMPIYVRDKVAQTIAEREAVAASKAAALAGGAA